MSFDVSFITSLINLPCAFKPQPCRPVTQCNYWHVCKWAAYIPLDPHGILGNVWVPCIVHCNTDRLLRQLSQWWKKRLGSQQWKYEMTMWTDFSIWGDVQNVCTEGLSPLRADTCNTSWTTCVCIWRECEQLKCCCMKEGEWEWERNTYLTSPSGLMMLQT